MLADIPVIPGKNKRLGLGVVRTWAFNTGLPLKSGLYDEEQQQALDYVVAAAGRRGVKLVLALGNFWHHYFDPEDWLAMAEGSAAGKNVADFYRSPAVAALYSKHIAIVTGRVSSISGVARKDDPAILGWDVFNEPRCPGCDAAAAAARDSFLSSMAATLKAAAPGQLTFSGTEGYFGPGDAHVSYNSGAGGQCEGEKWPQDITHFDVATTHMYYRQLEQQEALGWRKPDFNFYVNYLHRKIALYDQLAGRPLVIEEFGISRRFFGDEEQKVVAAVVADALIAAKRAGRNLKGAMLWSATLPSMPDIGGYNFDITRKPSGAAVGLGNAAMHAGTAGSGVNAGNANIAPAAASGGSSSSSTSSAISASPTPAAPAASGRRKLMMLDHAEGLLDSVPDSHTAAAASLGFTPATSHKQFVLQQQQRRRRWLQQATEHADDTLDSFRRGTPRGACAHSAAYGWSMAGGVEGEGVDVAAYRRLVAGHDMVDILAEAARLLRS